MAYIDSRILETLSKISDTSKRKEKIELLALHFDDVEFFKDYLIDVLDPNTNYYITAVPTDVHAAPHPEVDNIEDAIRVLKENVATRLVTGNAAKELVASIHAALDIDGKELLSRLLKRDLRCGVSVKTLNAASDEELIYVPGYMRCSALSIKTLSNLSFPVISQIKMDGLFVNIFVTCNSVRVLTRSGQDITTSVISDPAPFIEALGAGNPGLVFHGELMALDENGKIMDRAEGNGYLNGLDVDPKRVGFYLWDSVSIRSFVAGKSLIPYETRKIGTEIYVQSAIDLGLPVQFVESILAYSVDDVVEHFRKARCEGLEGTVIKSRLGVWKDGTSNEVVKVKVVFDTDLSITDIYEGTGKYEGMLGGMTVVSGDGVVITCVGTGFSDEQRREYWEKRDFLIGKIVKVKANDLTNTLINNFEDGRPVSTYSLFLPRFIEIRHDKNEADTFDKIREQVSSFNDMLALLHK